MAEKKFFVDINLQGSALTNATIGTNSSLTKAGSFGFDGTRLKYFNGTAIEEVANLADVAAVTGGLIFQGGYDPETAAPDISDGTAYKGFFWVATAAGAFFGESVQVGDSIVAKVDGAGATIADWLILQGNIVIATDSVDGISRLATQAEADAGTEGGAVVITPATLQGKIDAQITPEISSKLPLAGGTMTGTLDINSNSITNIGAIYTANIFSKDGVMDVNAFNNLSFGGGATATNLPAPTNGGDAANKTYVDDNTSNKLPLAGGNMSGTIDMGGNNIDNAVIFDSQFVNADLNSNLNANGNTIINLLAPTNNSDAAHKLYVDNAASTAQANAEATASADATAKADAAEAAANAYTDTGLAAKLNLSGGTMSGNINMNDAGSVYGAINLSGQYLVIDGIEGNADSEIIVSGVFNMDGNSITNVSAPTANGDAANKLYVDTAASTAESNANDYTDAEIAALSFVGSYLVSNWVFDAAGGYYYLEVVHNLDTRTPKVVTSIYEAAMGVDELVEFKVGIALDGNTIILYSNTLPDLNVSVGVSI
jgi:hypothetical protein